MPQKPTGLAKGRIIPWDIGPKENLRVPSARQLRMIIAVCNSLLNLRVSRGGRDDFQITDNNAALQIARALESGADSGNEPFEILTPHEGTDDFRTIQVNAGVLTALMWPDATVRDDPGMQLISDVVTNFNDNLTLAASGNNIVRIEWDAGGWAVVANATNDGSWTNFGFTDNYHFVIGQIDALTNAASKELLVSQYVLGHQLWQVTGEFDNQVYPSVAVWDGDYSGSTAYVAGQSFVVGQVADGFPARGLYVFIDGGGGVGPGGDFKQLSTF